MSYLVTKSMIRAKTSFRGLPVPASIAITCPHCNDFLTYFCRDYALHAATNTITFLGTCPACEAKVSFWLVNSRDYENRQIFMYPSLAQTREIMQGIEAVPQTITDNYLEALETYQHQYYKATTTMVRASLEDIFKTNLGQGEVKELAALVMRLAEKINLTEQVNNIASTIADNQQLLPYFAFDKRPTQETAAALLKLLEFILTYTYVIPAATKRLQHEINCLDQEKGTD